MPHDPAVSELMAHHHGALVADWRQRLDPDALNSDELDREIRQLLDALSRALGGGARSEPAGPLPSRTALDAVLSSITRDRALRGVSAEASVRLLHAGRDAVLALLNQHLPDGREPGAAHQRSVTTLMDGCVTTVVSQFVAAREAVIRDQAQSLLDMSTPVITLWDSILLLPLVGVIDSVRAVQIAERLLEAIGRTEAVVTLIDVTGVPVMDTSVARHLLRTVAAAEMLGTRVVLTGISPTTAQTMVKLGIDMSSVPTRGSLKAGVALALQLTGRRVTSGQEH
jgi:rsbT co-antagonist protein RsbR